MTLHLSRSEALIRRRTKIVATIGPASREPAVLSELIRAGVNVFRLNLSHGEHADHRVNFERIRAAAEAAGEPVAVLADLCGPKIRGAKFAGCEVVLEAGKSVVVTTRDVVGDGGSSHRNIRPSPPTYALATVSCSTTGCWSCACRAAMGPRFAAPS
jgi:pyruvate kinase